MLRHAFRESLSADWAKTRTVPSFPCTLAIALALGFGLATDNLWPGMLAASGAMSVGFGSFQRLGRSRIRPMLWAAVGMALFTAAGSLFGRHAAGIVLLSSAVGFFYGLTTAVSGGSGWISLQWSIFALIATGFPASLDFVLRRSGWILAGGALQISLVLCFRRLSLRFVPRIRRDSFRNFSAARQMMRTHFQTRSAEFFYSVRLAMALGLAALAGQLLALSNHYWVPMTALLVLRSDLHQTLTRGLARLGGTLLGAGLATLLASLWRPGPIPLAVFVVLFAWLCYSVLNVNYGAFSASITAYIAFLLALTGLPEREIAVHRVANTFLGGTIALAVAMLGPRKSEAATETRASGESASH